MSLHYRGYVIEKKRDFVGFVGFDSGFHFSEAYVATNGGMINVIPGAGFFRTPKEAKEGIDILIAVGEAHFHDAYRAVQAAKATAAEHTLRNFKEKAAA